MLTTSSALVGLAATVMFLGSDGISGQPYPNKPIRIVTSPVAGGGDFTSRLIAQGLTASVGWQLVVENRPGGAIQGQIVSQASPDGYTLLLTGGPFYIGPLLEKTPYDPVKDFSPITMTDRAPQVVVVHPSLAITSVKELIANAKARPGELNYATSSLGGANHLAAELFKSMANVNIVRINYKGSGAAAVAVMAGEVQLFIGSVSSVGPYVRSGKLRALAVTSPEPSALAPGLPPVAATLPGFVSTSMSGLFAPAKTPEAIIKRLNQEVARVLNQPAVKQRFLDTGVESASSSPEEFAAAIKAEITRLSKVIKEAGIKVE